MFKLKIMKEDNNEIYLEWTKIDEIELPSEIKHPKDFINIIYEEN